MHIHWRYWLLFPLAKEREVSIVSEKSTIFMTADEKHKWRLYKGVWRVWWERDVKQSTTILWNLFDSNLGNNRHFATPPCTRVPAKRSLRNDCRNSILMTRRGTTNQKNHIDRGSDTSSVWNFCARFLRRHFEETSGGVAKSRLFSQATIFHDNYFSVFYWSTILFL